MSPWAKSGLTWATVLCVIATGFAVRYAVVLGLFSSIQPIVPSVCRTIAAGINGQDDFIVDSVREVVYIAARNPQSPDPRDGIYLLKLNNLAAPPVKLAGTPAGFRPGGLSLYHALDGAESLLAIDQRAGGRSGIETYGVNFDGDTPALVQQSTVQSRNLVSPNALNAFAADHYYVSNDHVATGALGRFAEDYLLWRHADVLLSNGTALRIAAQRIAHPGGLLIRSGILYIAAANERRVIAMSIEDITGNLTQLGEIALPARLSNMSLDVSGNLIVAGQTRPGTAQIFQVKLGPDGVPKSYDTIFSDDGHLLKGASAAALWNGRLLISSADDSKMLDCDIK